MPEGNHYIMQSPLHGQVTLEEFSAIMTGEISGQDPYEEARTAFTVLSRCNVLQNTQYV